MQTYILMGRSIGPTFLQQYSNVPIQLFKCLNIQMLNCSNIQIFKCSNIQIFKYCILLRHYVQISDVSGLRAIRNFNSIQVKYSNSFISGNLSSSKADCEDVFSRRQLFIGDLNQCPLFDSWHFGYKMICSRPRRAVCYIRVGC